MIKKVRVDYRLIHGQVTSKWMQVIDADTIFIVSDEIMKDELKRSVMRLAVPFGVKLVIKNVNDAIEALNSGVTDKYKLFILCEKIDAVYRLSKAVPEIKEINIGTTLAQEDKKLVSRAIYLTELEILQLKELLSAGIDINIQMIPSESPIKMETVLP